jgi:uncharacterized protein (DUF736 family)
MMERKPNVSFKVRITSGRQGHNPNAPDWEVCELVDGQINSDAEIYDNLTKSEAEDLAAMWSRKKEEAESEKAN